MVLARGFQVAPFDTTLQTASSGAHGQWFRQSGTGESQGKTFYDHVRERPALLDRPEFSISGHIVRDVQSRPHTDILLMIQMYVKKRHLAYMLMVWVPTHRTRLSTATGLRRKILRGYAIRESLRHFRGNKPARAPLTPIRDR